MVEILLHDDGRVLEAERNDRSNRYGIYDVLNNIIFF